MRNAAAGYTIGSAVRLFSSNGFEFIKLAPNQKKPLSRNPTNKGHLTIPDIKETYRAIREGFNIGVIPPPNIIIFDFDNHGKADGLETLKQLQQLSLVGDLDELFVVETPTNGGLHVYFKLSENCADRVTKDILASNGLDNGLDIIKSPKYVLMPGCHLPHGTYKLRNPDIRKIPLIPNPLEEMVLYEERAIKPAVKKKLPRVNIELVSEILDCIPNNDDFNGRDEWLRVVSAIHHATRGSEDGYTLANEWSEEYPGHDSDQFYNVWNSLGKNKSSTPITFLTLVHYAKNYKPQTVSNVLDDFGFTEHLKPLPPHLDFNDLPAPELKDTKNDEHVWKVKSIKLDPNNIKPSEWLISGILPKAVFTVMAGQQGKGKTTLALAISAMITKGGPYEGDEDNPLVTPPGTVLYFSQEEMINESITPKLCAHGADLNNFRVIKSGCYRTNRKGRTEFKPFSISTCMDILDRTVKYIYKDTRLIIFDPLPNYVITDVGMQNDHSTMNQVLSQLNDFAERTGITVWGLTHFNKNSSAVGDDRVMGARAYTSVPRHVTLAIPHNDKEHLILATQKSNINPNGSALWKVIPQEPQYIEGYATPLLTNKVELINLYSDKNAEEWIRELEADTESTARVEVNNNLELLIEKTLSDKSKRLYWNLNTFINYIHSQYRPKKSRDKIKDTIETLFLCEKVYMHMEKNKRYIWTIDGMVEDTEEAIQDYNNKIIHRIINSNKSKRDYIKSAIMDEIYLNAPQPVAQSTLPPLLTNKLKEIINDVQISKAVCDLKSEGRVTQTRESGKPPVYMLRRGPKDHLLNSDDMFLHDFMADGTLSLPFDNDDLLK